MSQPITVTIGTGNKISADYQSQDVHVSVTYELERSDTDLKVFIEEKASEVERMHSLAWRTMREQRSELRNQGSNPGASTDVEPNDQQPPAQAPAKRGTRTRIPAPAPVLAEQAANNPPSANGNIAGNGHAASPLSVHAANGNGAVPVSGNPTEPASDAQQRAIRMLVLRAGLAEEDVITLLVDRFDKASVDALSRAEAGQMLLELQRAGRETALPMAA